MKSHSRAPSHLLLSIFVHDDVAQDQDTVLVDSLVVRKLLHGVQRQFDPAGLDKLLLKCLCRKKRREENPMNKPSQKLDTMTPSFLKGDSKGMTTLTNAPQIIVDVYTACILLNCHFHLLGLILHTT